MEGKEKAKPKGGKPRGYSLNKENKKICDEQIKDLKQLEKDALLWYQNNESYKTR